MLFTSFDQLLLGLTGFYHFLAVTQFLSNQTSEDTSSVQPAIRLTQPDWTKDTPKRRHLQANTITKGYTEREKEFPNSFATMKLEDK